MFTKGVRKKNIHICYPSYFIFAFFHSKTDITDNGKSV